MIDPGLPKTREGVRISVKDRVRLNNELSRAQMPPHVRIRHVSRRHGEKTQRKDDHEHAARLEEPVQDSRIIPRVRDDYFLWREGIQK